jgi:hypothetical protein
MAEERWLVKWHYLVQWLWSVIKLKIKSNLVMTSWKGQYFVSLYTNVVIMLWFKVRNWLIGTIEYPTLYTRRHINRYLYNRAWLCLNCVCFMAPCNFLCDNNVGIYPFVIHKTKLLGFHFVYFNIIVSGADGILDNRRNAHHTLLHTLRSSAL